MNTFGKIIFDCDSTLVRIEGLDMIADLKGKGREVAEFTKLSMDGKVKLEDVFALKMAMIRPSKQDLVSLGHLYVQHIVEDVEEVIKILTFFHKDILILTGNFYSAVKVLSKQLKIPLKNIYSNKIYFNRKGHYIGFDAHGPLSISGGKRTVLKTIAEHEPHKRIAFIGDGSTDTDTKPPVDLFIGYGGVVQRENVKKNSDIYITCQSMAPILRFVLDKNEQKQGELLNRKIFLKADMLIDKKLVILPRHG